MMSGSRHHHDLQVPSLARRPGSGGVAAEHIRWECNCASDDDGSHGWDACVRLGNGTTRPMMPAAR